VIVPCAVAVLAFDVESEKFPELSPSRQYATGL